MPAQSLVVVVKAPYENVRRELRETVAEKIGIVADGEVGEHDHGILPEQEELPRGGLFRSLLFGRGFVQFRTIGVRIHSPNEYQLKSRRYNEIKKLNGSSELRLRVADGRALFGRTRALIVMSRIDYTREYTRYYDIPLPPKEPVEKEVITDTEIRLVEHGIGRLGHVEIRYFIPYPGHRGEEYWMKFLQDIRDAGMNP